MEVTGGWEVAGPHSLHENNTLCPGKGSEGSGAMEVPTDYKLDEVGKSSTSAVAGGVVRPGMRTADDDSTERIVSPIQRGKADDEEE